MKMIITRTSRRSYKETKVFISLQELLDFVKEQKEECILIPPYPYGDSDEWTLEIYDDYRE